ncbi:hypothetical protein [Streptomyces sp. NPDC020917]|uniref:hypothetical protein n=1 Tax=Streptomyces sp. NPDC020917 TaxID=3365102 RepID=UPI0037903FDF
MTVTVAVSSVPDTAPSTMNVTEQFLACFRAQAARQPGASAAAAVRSGLAGRTAANPLDTPA